MLEAILNLLFPPKCPACGSYVEHNGHWCGECLDKILRPRRLPLDGEMASLFTGGVMALTEYEGPVKKLIADVKFEKKKSAVKSLQYFVEQGVAQIDLQDIDLVVSVPLHKNKLKQRGFNQSVLLFNDAVQNADEKLREVLVRVQETSPQFGLKLAERQENIRGAFAIAPAAESFVKDKNILLVDDIFTTGATFAECGRILHKAGAASIRGLVIASNHQ